MSPHQLAALGVFVVACGSAPPTEVPAGGGAAMCDGSDQLTMQFVVLNYAAHAGHLSFPYRNGAYFLRVDGRCRYWVYGLGLSDAATLGPAQPRTTTALDPITTGVLSGEEAEQLATEIHYLRWKDYDGRHAELTAVGMTPSVFTDGQHEFSCAVGCDAPGMPSNAAALRTTALDWIVRLTDSGQPVGGPVRVATFNSNTSRSEFEGRGYNCLPAVLPLQPSAYAQDDLASVITGTLMTEEAPSLRAVRTQFRADRFRFPRPSGIPPISYNVDLPVCDQERVWSLIVSDVLEPYEIDGFVPK